MGMGASGRARRRLARVTLVALLAGSSTFLLHGVASAAVNCDAVFEGETPADPIVKTADKTSAYAGQTVTFTLTFTATGTATNVTDDCYRVDGGGNAALNALVAGFDAEQTNDNIGGKDAVQHVTYTITIPSDASLIDHDIVDRAKATSGSVESRSDLITVHVVAPPAPSPSPSPSISATQTTPTPSSSVRGVTLGRTGSSTGDILWLAVMLIVLGIGLSRVKVVRSIVPAVSARIRGRRR